MQIIVIATIVGTGASPQDPRRAACEDLVRGVGHLNSRDMGDGTMLCIVDGPDKLIQDVLAMPGVQRMEALEARRILTSSEKGAELERARQEYTKPRRSDSGMVL